MKNNEKHGKVYVLVDSMVEFDELLVRVSRDDPDFVIKHSPEPVFSVDDFKDDTDFECIYIDGRLRDRILQENGVNLDIV